MTYNEHDFPWEGVPPTLNLPTEEKFSSLVTCLTTATRQLAQNYHFDSLTSLVNLHSKFRSLGNANLEEVWRSIPVEECATKEDLICVGLALVLKDIIIKMNPELEDFIAMTVSNQWKSGENAPLSFWTDKQPPSFPEQCREHSLLFIRASLSEERTAIIFLDPGRCLGQPLIVTNDGLPPQSPTMSLERYNKTKEYTVSWGGSEYMRWIVRTVKENGDSDMILRVYVGGCFRAGSYLDWHNLIFPYRAIMIMTCEGGLESYYRLDLNGDPNYGLFCLNAQKENCGEHSVPFGLREDDLNELQLNAVNAVAERIGKPTLVKLMSDLGVVLSDSNFIHQVMDLWKKVKQETEVSLAKSCNVTEEAG